MPAEPSRAVFLSYASQDAEAVERIAKALRAAGVEVWFDRNELVGGDAWDQKIRKQIKECALFVPVISANTNARAEGYFRLEWKLAVDRSHLMADDAPFLFPVVIDDTTDAAARVPDRFREVQWTRLNVKDTPESLATRVAKLLGGAPAPERRATAASAPAGRNLGSWVGLVATIGGVLLGLIYATRGMFWSPPRPVRDAKPAAAVAPAKPAATETEKLIAQMWAIYDKADDAAPDEWVLAEELGAKATTLEPQNAEAWAAYANVAVMRYVFGYVLDHAQIDRATKLAQRAVTLAPEATSSQLALANCYRWSTGSTLDDAERIVRALVAREPSNRRVLRMAGNVMRIRGKYDEAIAFYDRAIALAGSDPISLISKEVTLRLAGRLAEGEQAVDQSLALRFGPRAFARKLFYLIQVHNDLAAAAALIAKAPAHFLQRDEAANEAALVWLWRRQSDPCIEVLRRFDGDELFGTPKAYIIGQAYAAAGQPAAAQVEWRAGLQKLDAKLAAEPNVARRIYWKAVLSALLGEQSEAARLLPTFQQMSSGRITYNSEPILIVLGRHDDALAVMEEGVKQTLTPNKLDWASFVRHDPIYDPLRNLPRFQAVLTRLNADLVRTAPAAVKADDKSVAVLAFANLSDDKANEYFSDGISEELINVLAKVPGLKVSARTSAFYFKGKEVPVPEIAQKLGVAYVVEGSVRKSGHQVRITAQLIKAADGFHVWSDTFTRDLKDIFAVQDEIAGLVAQNLKLELTGDSRPQVVDPEAHRLVLEGVHYWNLRTEDGFNRAETAFRQAIERDPNFAPAHAGLANALGTRLAYELYAGATGLAIGPERAAARRALALDPALAEGHAALAMSYLNENRQKEAAQEFQKGLALNPNSALLHHWYSLVLENGGRLDEALAEIGRATQLDPLSGIALITRERMLTAAGRYAEALGLHDRVVGLMPGAETAAGFQAISLLKLGRREEATAVAQAISATSPMDRRITVDAEIVYVLRQTGHDAEAAAHARKILPRFRPESYQRGAVLAALGRWDEARPFLERTPPIMHYAFYWDQSWDEWREDPRFQRLLVKLGCAEEYRVARETLARMQQDRQVRK